MINANFFPITMYLEYFDSSDIHHFINIVASLDYYVIGLAASMRGLNKYLLLYVPGYRDWGPVLEEILIVLSMFTISIAYLKIVNYLFEFILLCCSGLNFLLQTLLLDPIDYILHCF